MRFEVESTDTLLKHFGVDAKVGRKQEDIAQLQELHGYNELEKDDATPLWELILEQFDDTLVKILLAAAAISFVLATLEEDSGEEGLTAYVEPIVILVILILNAIVGVWQESNAEAALEALKDLQSEHARVLRDGHMKTIEARDLVPGDVVEVRTGDKVPADVRLFWLKTTTLRVEQAQLTGESVSVEKDVDPLPESTEDIIQAKTNMLFSTTVVVSGMGHGLVVETGMDTEIGQIQKSVQEAAEEDDSTPLKKKLDEFGDLLSKVILVICIIVWIINYKNFFDPAHGSALKGCIYYFKIAVALAVAAIPEGLPAVITTCLALGTRKMAKKHAIVRKLPSVETLGCTNVICSDKTGTLTTNEMSCVIMAHAAGNESTLTTYEVEGHTYSPEGKVKDMVNLSAKTKHLNMMAAICSQCNESTIEYDGSKYVRVGEPTEAALSVLVEKMGVPDAKKQKVLDSTRSSDPAGTVHFCSQYWHEQYPIVATLEFNRDRKSMSVLCKNGKNNNLLLVKGAPEGIIQRCSKIMLENGKIVNLGDMGKQAVGMQVEAMASKALRCLALAYKEETGVLAKYNGERNHEGHKALSDTAGYADIESDLVFCGLVGMLDPPRPEIAPMIEVCHTANIRVIMITGDNKLTAESICRMVGIFGESESLDDVSFTGGEFFSMPEAKQQKILSGGGLVFSRTEPKHKQQLVRLLKRHGDIVAMTGDGVNDAPALKQADIGVAMGITGTEVAKEASDMILADDNFATIVSAVGEGRAIYDNMQAFIRYLISSNIGEVAAIFFTAALGLPEGLLPVQLLWVNLVTDGPPATALGFNPADADIMKKAPRSADDDLINGWTFFRMMVVGIYVGFSCVGILAYWYIFYQGSDDGHSLVSFYQLTHWTECHKWDDFEVNNFGGMDFSSDPCRYFTEGKTTASTLSLSVLVTIEMLNAFNALSEDGSLLTKAPWVNPFLLIATAASFAMHFLILYVDVLSNTFGVVPLDFNEWMLVLAFSAPVIFIDEILKIYSRRVVHAKNVGGEAVMNGNKKDQ